MDSFSFLNATDNKWKFFLEPIAILSISWKKFPACKSGLGRIV